MISFKIKRQAKNIFPSDVERTLGRNCMVKIHTHRIMFTGIPTRVRIFEEAGLGGSVGCTSGGEQEAAGLTPGPCWVGNILS